MDLIKIQARSLTTPYSMTQPHNHAFYELHFMLEGKRNIFSHNRSFIAPPKSFFIVPPFVLHQTSGGPYSRINIILYASALSYEEIAFLEDCSKKDALFFAEAYEDFCFDIIKRLSELDVSQEEYRQALTKALLFYMQNQTLRSIENNTTIDNDVAQSPLVIKIVKYLNANYSNNVTLDLLQKEFHLSKTYLCAIFKKAMNCTLIDYLIRIRITKAMNLLLFSKKSVESISEICGFSSSNYFRLVFKKETGISPLQYRKQNSIS